MRARNRIVVTRGPCAAQSRYPEGVLRVALQILDPEIEVPRVANPGDAGYDLVARERVLLSSGGGRALIPTGIALAIPHGYAGFIQPRSGLALRHGVTCLNTPGLIDAGYRGEIKVLLINTDPSEDYLINRGDRIAQLVIQAVEELTFDIVDQLDDSTRSADGFGSTGR